MCDGICPRGVFAGALRPFGFGRIGESHIVDFVPLV